VRAVAVMLPIPLLWCQAQVPDLCVKGHSSRGQRSSADMRCSVVSYKACVQRHLPLFWEHWHTCLHATRHLCA
jgi:hypothetical protein